MMNVGQLSAFRTRMMKAAAKGRGVARAMDYVAMLDDMGGSAPSGMKAGSAAHLMAMADSLLRGKPKRKGARKAAPTPPPPPSGEAAWHEGWNKGDLYELAKKYEIPERSKMGAAELIAAIEAYEAAD